jgi:hypothetical protein
MRYTQEGYANSKQVDGYSESTFASYSCPICGYYVEEIKQSEKPLSDDMKKPESSKYPNGTIKSKVLPFADHIQDLRDKKYSWQYIAWSLADDIGVLNRDQLQKSHKEIMWRRSTGLPD